MKYQKKPVVIEAMQFIRDATGNDILKWANAGLSPQDNAIVEFTDETGSAMRVVTLEGTMVANDGDWIIKGVKGEFYPCKPDIFLATYGPADENPEQTRDNRSIDELLLTAHLNLAQAVSQLREAQAVDRPAEDRELHRQIAKDELGCLVAHFESALDLIPSK